MKVVVNVLVGILGLGSIIFGIIGFNGMDTFWRVAHVVAGILMMVAAVPLVLRGNRDVVA